jgi:hypothetical protein
MIKIEKKLIAYDSITMEPVYPQYAGITEEKIRSYLAKHFMPEDPAYTPEELIMDLTDSEGIYILPSTVKEETIDYISDLLNALV